MISSKLTYQSERSGLENFQVLRKSITGDYRYEEADHEIKGEGNSVNYKYRMHDPRIGRFFAVDPLAPKFPFYSPYSFSGNRLIHAIELEGLEEIVYQYKLDKNNKATLIKKNNYSYLKESGKNYRGAPNLVKFDKRTNKRMSPSDVNKVQYQYFDENGNRLNIRRNNQGEYVEGENELMSIGSNNAISSIYIGADNPVVTVNGKEEADYRREPQDEMDKLALQHDKGYDDVGAKGFSGAVLNLKTLPADIALWMGALKVLEKYENEGLDEVTGKKVSYLTMKRAKMVVDIFQSIVAYKLQKSMMEDKEVKSE